MIALMAIGGLGRSALAQDPEPPPADPQTAPQPPPSSPEEPPAPAGEKPEVGESAVTPLPDAKQLIEESRAACGSPEKIAALTSVTIRAVLPLPTGENHLEIYCLRAGAFRFDQRGPEQPGVTVIFDGKVGWIVYSGTRHELIDEFRLERGRHQFNAMFPYWLVLFPEQRFKSFETVEKAPFNEHECYKVRLHEEESRGVQRFAHFDVNEKLMRGMTVTQETAAGPVTVQFKFDQWQQIDDVKVFTRINIDQPNQPMVLTYTQVEFNTVDQAMFEQPAAVKEMVEKRDAPPPPPDAEDTPPASEESPPPEAD
jgi:hypothetical protein